MTISSCCRHFPLICQRRDPRRQCVDADMHFDGVFLLEPVQGLNEITELEADAPA